MGPSRLAHIPSNNFVILGTFDKRKIPVIFSLLGGKTTYQYRRLFQIIKQKIGQKFNILHWAPEKIISDFETGLIAAVQTEFPHAIHWGGFFHFTQAIFRRIQNSGLQIPYRGHENLKKNSGKLCLWVCYHWGKFEMLLWIYWTKSQPGLFSSDTQNYEIFSNIFKIHGF